MIAHVARSSRSAHNRRMIAKADFIEGMAKGMAVLESFDTERQRLNATLAAQRAGITRAAARRHLLTLAHLGYLETDGSYFWLSAKVLRFSGSYLASARLPRLLQPTLNRLAAQTQESFSAVVLDGDEVVIVARSVSDGRRHAGAGLWPASGRPAAGARHVHRPDVAVRAAQGRLERLAQGAHAAAIDAPDHHRCEEAARADRRGGPGRLLRGQRGARAGRACPGRAAAQHAGQDGGGAQRGGAARRGCGRR